MSSSVDDAGWVNYRSERTDERAPAASLVARYRPSGPVESAAPGSLAAFLTDRRGLYAADGAGRLSWSAIRHQPWPLQPAEADIERNTMATAPAIELPDQPPLLHFARRLDVVAWWPRRSAGAGPRVREPR